MTDAGSSVAPRLPASACRGQSTDYKMTPPNSFGSRSALDVAGRQYTIFRLDSLSQLAGGNAQRLPFSLKILLENLLRNEDGKFVKPDDIRALAGWDVKGKVEKEIA